VAVTVGLTMLIVPLAAEALDASVTLGGMAIFLGLTAVTTQWRRKRALYETLTILADPAHEPDGV